MITLPSVKGQKDNKKPQENVANEYNQLQNLENKRMARKKALLDAMNKVTDPDIA